MGLAPACPGEEPHERQAGGQHHPGGHHLPGGQDREKLSQSRHAYAQGTAVAQMGRVPTGGQH